MKGGTMFSGIGAPEQSAPWIDWRWACEIEKFPAAVLKARHPGVVNLGDVTKVDWDAAERVDVIVFGSPCQAFSVAGKRAGLDDPRGDLTLTGLAVVGRMRPRWVVWENVPGVLSIDGGRTFGTVLGLLGKLGYGFAYRVLDAQYFGVPQRRRRVFLVGYLGDWRRAAAVLFERESLQGHPPPRREAGQGTACDVAPGLTASGRGVGCTGESRGQDPVVAVQAFGGNDTSGPIDVATTRMAGGASGARLDFESETFIAHSLRGEGFDASEDGTGRGTPLVPVAFNLRGREDGAQPEADDLVSVRAASGGSSRIYIAFSAKDHGADAGEIAPTLRAGGHTGSHANAGVMPAVAVDYTNCLFGADVTGTLKHAQHKSNSGHGVMAGSLVRRLMPVECDRLQGFPDDYTDIPWRGKAHAPDGPRYKADGNSMHTGTVGWVLARIRDVDTLVIPEQVAA